MIGDFTLAKAKARYWLEDQAKEKEIWGPVGEEGRIRFQKNPSADTVVTDFSNSLECPKSIFFPERESILSYSLEGASGLVLERQPDDTTPRLVFGLRPPDVRGVEIFDAYWLKGAKPDSRYKARRDNTVLACIGYHNPPPCCFAEAVGVDLFPETGPDLLLTDLGRSWYVQVLTDKGMATIGEQFDPAEQDHRDDARNVRDKAIGSTRYDLRLERWAEFNDSEILALPYWEEVYLGMVPGPYISRYFWSGTHCRLLDVSHGSKGERYRVWSHPHSPGYSRLADGDDYRPGMKERVRDWILEMFLWFPRRHGFIGCSGAHRCVAAVPTQHDLRTIVANVRFE